MFMIQVGGGLIDTVPPKSNNCGTRLYDDDINGHVVKKKQLSLWPLRQNVEHLAGR
jgi:hypothetical protein